METKNALRTIQIETYNLHLKPEQLIFIEEHNAILFKQTNNFFLYSLCFEGKKDIGKYKIDKAYINMLPSLIPYQDKLFDKTIINEAAKKISKQIIQGEITITVVQDVKNDKPIKWIFKINKHEIEIKEY
jgi:hypothetical protein